MIESYKFGQIIIDKKKYTSDLIIFKDHIYDSWWRKEGHNLCIDDIKEIIDEKPDTLIIGTGCYGLMKIPEELIEHIKSSGIKQVIIEKTRDACTEYNKLYKTNKIIAAFHLTC